MKNYNAKLIMLESLCNVAQKIAEEIEKEPINTETTNKFRCIISTLKKVNRPLKLMAQNIKRRDKSSQDYPYIEYENNHTYLVQPTNNGDYVAWCDYVTNYEAGIIFRNNKNNNFINLFYANSEKENNNGKIIAYTFDDIIGENYPHHITSSNNNTSIYFQ